VTPTAQTFEKASRVDRLARSVIEQVEAASVHFSCLQDPIGNHHAPRHATGGAQPSSCGCPGHEPPSRSDLLALRQAH
jgi:hypothetical protein